MSRAMRLREKKCEMGMFVNLLARLFDFNAKGLESDRFGAMDLDASGEHASDQLNDHSGDDERRPLPPARLPLTGGGDSDPNDDDGAGDGTGTTVITKPKSRTKTPSLYRVIIVNDDYTPMEFVIHVLQKFFMKSIEEATRIMLQVHQQGAGVCGVYSFEIAETKVYQVNQYARKNRHPLKCTMEMT